MKRLYRNTQYIFLSLFLAVLAASTYAYCIALAPEGPYSLVLLLQALYQALQLFVLEGPDVTPKDPPLLWLMRFSAPALLISTAVASGFAWIAHNLNYISQRAKLRLTQDQLVICGQSELGLLLAASLLQEQESNLVILVSRPTDLFLQRLASLPGNPMVVAQNASYGDMLTKTRLLKNAQALVLALEDQEQTLHLMAQLSVLLQKHGRQRPTPLETTVRLNDYTARKTVAQFQAVAPGHAPNGAGVVFHAINQWHLVARHHINQLAHKLTGLSGPPHTIEILVMGVGALSEALVIEMAYLLHLPKKQPICVTVVDYEVQAWHEALLQRYPSLLQVMEVKPVGYHDFFGPSYKTPEAYQQVYITYPGIDMALTMVRRLCQQLFREHGVPPRLSMLAIINEQLPGHFLQQHAGARAMASQGLSIVPWHTSEGGASLINRASTIERRAQEDAYARVFHENWREAHADPGDAKNVAWEHLNDWEKEMNRLKVRHLQYIKLPWLGLKVVDQPTSEASWQTITEVLAAKKDDIDRMEHERWMAEKLLNGYLGIAKDIEAAYKDFAANYKEPYMLHPDLVPWEALSNRDKAKDEEPLEKFVQWLGKSGKGLALEEQP